MRRQRGVALLMALWALALVAALLPVLLAEGRAELQRARLLEHETLARALAAGAEQVVTQGLIQAGARQRPEFWQSLRGEVLAYEVEGAQVRAQLRDLHGCFNVNALAGPERDLALRQLKQLLAQRLRCDQKLQFTLLTAPRLAAPADPARLLPFFQQSTRMTFAAETALSQHGNA